MTQAQLELDKTNHPATPTDSATNGLSIKQIVLGWWPALILAVLGLIARGLTTPWYIESRDGLFFTRGVVRYATAEMRPHWPGYPVYIWLGKFLNLFFHDPVLSLHVLSTVASSLTVIPVYALAKDWRQTLGSSQNDARFAGGVAAGLWLLFPLSWITGTEIFSDALALLLGLSLIWLCWLAIQTADDLENLLIPAALVGGLLVGVRLSYITFLIPLFYVLWLKRSYRLGKIPLFLYSVGTLGVTGLVWLGWQLLMEGSRFFEATNQHLSGHYSSWGGSITTDHNILTRPLRLLETNVIYGFGGWWPDNVPLWRIPATLLVGALLVLGMLRLWRTTNKQPLFLVLLTAIPYLLWIVLGNDVDLARYSLPFVALGAIVAALGLPTLQKGAYLLAAGTLVALAVVSVPLGIEHRDSLPVMHPLTNYLNSNLDSAVATVIVTDDVSHLIFFTLENSPQIESIRVRTEEIDAKVNALVANGRTVYAVGLPNVKLSGWQPEARLCRSRFMESRGPLEIWLYRYAPGESKPAPAACY